VFYFRLIQHQLMNLNHFLTFLFSFTFITLHSQQWRQNFKITEPTRVANNFFGNSVSTFEGYVAYGVSQAHVGALENAGIVYIAKADCDGWSIYQEITSPDPIKFCGFGNNVLLKENTLLVTGCDPQEGNSIIYVYERDNNDNYVFKQKISHPQSIKNESFGFKFALSQNYLVVTAVNRSIVFPNNSLYNVTKGSAYIYRKTNNGNWSFIQKIEASDGQPLHHFGISVDIIENTIVIGSPREGINLSGAAYIFNKNNNSNTWSEVEKLTAFDYRGNQTNFGFNVEIEDDIIAISSGQDPNFNYENIVPDVTNGTGAVYLFKRNSNGRWLDHQKLTVTDNSAMILDFGDGLEMYEDQIAVGGQEKIFDPNGTLVAIHGRLYMFNKDLNDYYNEYQIIEPTRSAFPFASAISIYKEDMFVNAFWDSYDSNDLNFLSNSGSVYLYNTYEFKQVEKPILKPIPVLKSCDLLGNGLSTNFDMSSIENDLVENPEQYIFAYKDEFGNNLPSPLPLEYANSIPYSETIYVRIENKNNPNCYENTQIVLETLAVPELNEISDLFECDSMEIGYAFFDLSNLPSLLVQNPNQYDFLFFNSNSQDITQLINEPYRNTSENFEEITINIIDKNTLCFREKKIVLNVITTKANDIPLLQSCEIISDGLASFDTSAIEQQLLQGQTNKLITYYDENGSKLGSLLPNPYYIELNSVKTITALVEDSFFDCYDESTIIFNSNNCVEEDQSLVLTTPNFFTPNEDGINDTWQAFIPSSNISQNYITYIFDKYGKLLKTLEKNNTWDGFYNGNRMPSDDYWYQIVLEDGALKVGHFSLKR